MGFSSVFFIFLTVGIGRRYQQKREEYIFFKNKKINVIFSGDILYFGELKDLKVSLMLSES